jgi:hypothetical protein
MTFWRLELADSLMWALGVGRMPDETVRKAALLRLELEASDRPA